MPFDVEGARKAGYSDAEIVDHLAGERKFNAAGARQSGYSDAEILTHLRDPIDKAGAIADTRSAGEVAARGLGLGVRDVVEGAAALPGLVVDAVGYPVRAAGRALGYQMDAPTTILSKGLTAAGLPVAETPGEQMISGGVRGAASTLPTLGAGLAMQGARVMPSLANALAGGATGQAVGGATGEMAATAARQNDLGPVAELGAGLVGGLAGAGAVGAAGVAGRGLRAAAMPFGQEGREQITADLLLRSSGRPETLAARVADGAAPVVPGSLPTTAEAARDAGLAQLERAVQGMDPASADAFALRQAGRDQARRAEAVAIEPSTGGAVPLADAVRGGVAREEQRALQTTTRANALLQGRLGQLPGEVSPEAAGATVRGAVRDAEGPARAANSAQYEAIDPDGTSRLPMAPVRTAAAEAEAKYFGRGAGEMPSALRSAVDDLAQMGEAEPWRVMQNIRSRLGAIAGDPNLDPRAKSAARQIQGSIDQTAERAAMPQEMPSRPIGPDDIDAGYAAEGAAQHPDIAARLSMPEEQLAATIDAEQAPEGQSLIQFLRRKGGIQNQGDEVRTVMGTTRAMPALISGRGLTLDRAAELAWERGYLGPKGTTYTPRELLDAIDGQLRGLETRYPNGQVRVRDNRSGPSVADDLDREVAARGGNYDPRDPEATLRSLRDRPEDAPAAEPRDRFAPIEGAFTPEQAEAWRGASAGRRDLGDRFDSGVNEQILRRDMGRDVVPDSAVMGKVFKPGGGGPEALRQVRAEIAGNADAMAALEGHAATSLRAAAARPDGTLDPGKWQRWMAKHADVLREMPDLEGRMRSAGEAAATLDRVAFAAQARIKELENGVAKPFLDKDPDRAVRAALGSDNASSNIAELRRLVGSDPDALRSLRRSYLDEWMRRAETTTLDAQGNFRLAPAAAQRFARDHGGAARQIFGQADLARIQALADDFAGGSFTASAGKAAGSNTYQNLSTGNFIARLSNGTIDPNNAIAQALGSGFGILQKLVYAQPERLMRDLLREAMLDAAVARRVLSKASPDSVRWAAGYLEQSMGDRVRAAATTAATRQGVRSLNTEAMRPARENALSRGQPQRPAPVQRNTLMAR
jgi:hypothetical protein